MIADETSSQRPASGEKGEHAMRSTDQTAQPAMTTIGNATMSVSSPDQWIEEAQRVARPCD